MDDGIEKIEDDAALKQIRKQAHKVYIESALLAAALTIVVLFIPS